MTRQRMRRGEPYPSPIAHVLRGGRLEARLLLEDATRNQAIYGFYGNSVWLPSTEVAAEVLSATKLRRSAELTSFEVRALTEVNVRLWDTGVAPHYDVVYEVAGDVEALVASLMRARREVVKNVLYDPEGG